MKSFGKGFVFGTIATISAVAGCVYALDEHRKRAMRKRRSAHQN